MPKYKVIANPAAGHGKAAKAIPLIEQKLAELGLDYDLVRTNQAGNGIELAYQAARDGFQVVVAVGGDGTVNEVLNGLMKAQNEGFVAALGVICAGRGNDFAAGPGIPEDLEGGCLALKQDYRKTIDIGRVTGGSIHWVDTLPTMSGWALMPSAPSRWPNCPNGACSAS